MKEIDAMISLGKQLDEMQNAAHDLWTWLPSYKVAQKNHGDYADNFTPSIKDIIVEASMFMARVRDGLDKSIIDKILFNVGNTHDTSELWGHMRKEPETFRQCVTMALTKPHFEYTPEEQEWFLRCPCGEDHIPE